jgi:hypothetical protein
MPISDRSSYVSWGAILGGAVLACAFSLVMLQFGSAIGLSATNVVDGDRLVTPERVFAIAFWVLWIQVLASSMGGYLAGRLRMPVDGADAHESEVRDGAHGLLTWAVGTLAVFAAGALMAAFAALAPEQVEPVIRKTPEMLANEKAIAVISAFAAGATTLGSAVAAWWAATKGGDHRDSRADLSHYFSFRR